MDSMSERLRPPWFTPGYIMDLRVAKRMIGDERDEDDMTLTCPKCGGRWFNAKNDTCSGCGYFGYPVMKTNKERVALREKYEQVEKDKDWLFGPTRFAHTPQGTRMKGREE